MQTELLTALAIFAFAGSATPGPNNLMLMASGANFGFWRTLPHMLGVALGFMVMITLVGVGLTSVFDAVPASYTVLKVLSILYLLYLAWKIANAAPASERTGDAAPLTFVQAALFQWVNPKAWAMALTAVTAYAPSHDLLAVLIVAAVFGLVTVPVVTSWTALGEQMKRVLTNARRLRVFNVTMALLLVLSLYPVLLPS